MKEALIPIFLTEEEARRFILFNKYYSIVCQLEDIGALDIRSGSITINFNALGEVKGLKKEEFYSAS